jgi:hypothetical protein
MKTMTINATTALDELLRAAKSDRILLKQGEKPVALLINVEDKDEEQIELENDPSFWRMIEERRKRPTIPIEQVRQELLGGQSEAEDK